MALAFENKNTATVRAKSASGGFISMQGVNPDETSPDNLAAQVNKVLDIGGKAIVADENMTLERKKGVVDE